MPSGLSQGDAAGSSLPECSRSWPQASWRSPHSRCTISSFQLDGDVSREHHHERRRQRRRRSTGTALRRGGRESAARGFTAAGFDRDFLTNANGSFNTSDTSTFATGSKDTLPITPGWQCNFDNNVNSKIDIMNAYAAAYTAPNGDEILYFAPGAQREHRRRQRRLLVPPGRERRLRVGAAGTTTFTGDHTDGDLLIVSAFTNGGVVSTINVYRWNGGANGSPGSRTPVARASTAETARRQACATTTACATVNDAARSQPRG